ncbi:MAG: helix-turn-helix domain-containing protein [Synergistaceae bacterium]|jgi:quercetin dioxygenase-like cupin family protein/DNA-binding XRE family transcriptional regulator|nr:helix-turn-helix domain-containing protein [Synergistaceae bacterium]
MNVDNFIIGCKLKEFRREAGLSLAKAAERTGMTSAFISMVENGKCGISFQKTHALITLYGKTLADISSGANTDGRVVNLNAAHEVASEAGVKIFGLAKNEAPIHLGGFRLYFEPKAQHEFDHHDGVEYVLVLEGTFDLYLQGSANDPVEVLHLTQGDTTTYPSDVRHSFKNTGDKLGSLFIVETCQTRNHLV